MPRKPIARHTRSPPTADSSTRVTALRFAAAAAVCNDDKFLLDRVWSAMDNSGERLLLAVNKGFDESKHPLPANGVVLPSKPHGLNTFTDVDRVLFLRALNSQPWHFRFLEAQGIPGDEVRRAIVQDAAYQNVMRSICSRFLPAPPRRSST